jgi:hypothetical protein
MDFLLLDHLLRKSLRLTIVGLRNLTIRLLVFGTRKKFPVPISVENTDIIQLAPAGKGRLSTLPMPSLWLILFIRLSPETNGN